MDHQRSKSNSVFNTFIADPKKGQRTGAVPLEQTYSSGMFGTKIPENWESFPMNDTAIY